ncbi:MAG: Gfo/Idh/MocA family oxidoreductase [Saprospiraceae bacterium]|nr:Gfo/Idh/MocA family oxidoreductase [Lewinella sp.]
MPRSRRNFIRKMGAALIGAGFTGNVTLAQNSESIPLAQLLSSSYGPNDKIRLGAIGMGIMGFSNCRTALSIPGVELVATCDLYDGRLQHSKEVFGDHLFTTRDYREIIARDDIDAVIIATSDHWHDHIAIAAMKAGKHVYCEKPMVHHLDEGHAVIQAQKDTGMVFQVGSQRVSSIVYHKARELMADGIIGDLVLVEVWYDRHSALGAWQYSIPPDASPKTIDWDTFLGDAPKVPFDKVRFFRWRNYQDYGTAVAGDLFVHLFSGVHTILDSHGPNRIYASGGLRYWKDGRDVPDIILGIYDYPETDTHPAFNLQLRSNFVDGGGGGSMFRFVGSEGIMEMNGRSISVRRRTLPTAPGYGGWDSFGTFTEATQKAYKEWYEAHYPDTPRMSEPSELKYEAPQGYSDSVDHWATFLAGIRNNHPIIEDASFGLRAAGPSLASNMSYFQQQVINWDPERMIVKVDG